tara:strand:- start:109 stop:603 length:495 start_codon:yes stop_codon:yes gene_type:complete
MEISDLKKAVHKDLTDLKEKERLERVKKHSKLKTITLYTKDSPICDNMKKYLDEEGIKYEEKNIEENKIVSTTVGSIAVPVIFINNNYLVQGRDFQKQSQALAAINHYADPEFVDPPFESKVIEMLKNINTGINKNLGMSFQSLNKQLQPILKILKEIGEEDNA